MDKLNIKFYPQPTYNQSQIVKALSNIENQFNKAVDGRLFPVKRLTTGTYDMNINDGILICDTSGGNVTISLLPADEWNEKVLIVKRLDSGGSAGNVIVDPNGSETVDGSATDTITGSYQSKMYVAQGGSIFTI